MVLLLNLIVVILYVIKVYSQSIGAAAQLDWPKDRILIQVLDDSDDGNLQLLIKEEVASWKEKGINIVYRHRLIRTGYKAGNLKSAMSCDYIKDYEFVAIFDADFQPNPDFLKLTIPHFKVSINTLTPHKGKRKVFWVCSKVQVSNKLVFMTLFSRENLTWGWSRLDGPL